jgi:hypothetical protein
LISRETRADLLLAGWAERGVRTLEGLLAKRKTLGDQQFAAFSRFDVPLLPLDSPSLAVELAIASHASTTYLLVGGGEDFGQDKPFTPGTLASIHFTRLPAA